MSDLRELGDISLPFALDEKKNYIYIRDAYRDKNYYCPCCGKKVNTIAIDENKEYQMPPHYRHYPHQSCSGESLSHWVYKMWLFDKDSQFYVSNGTNKTLYTVKTIDIEKTYNTDYGNYRPDITITTVCDKIFFFELNFTSPKRSDDYFCKWTQLDYDVIEVDVKKLLKESLNNKIPTFRLIYSDGVCFDDKYNKRDVFANAANKLLSRKLEIKRQDMLNYKTVWEKLDWFFNSIKLYKAMKATMDDILNSFRNVNYDNMDICFDILKKISCIDNNQGFRDIINIEFYKHIDQYINVKKTDNKFIKSFDCNVELKKGCSVKINGVKKKCDILDIKSPTFSYYFENRKWHMGYNYYNEIICNIEKILFNFKDYYFIIDKINEKFTWDKYPLLYDSLNLEKIKLSNNYMSRDITLSSNYSYELIFNSIIKIYNYSIFTSYERKQKDIYMTKIKNIYKKILLDNDLFEFDLMSCIKKDIISIYKSDVSFYSQLEVFKEESKINIHVSNKFISSIDFIDTDSLYMKLNNIIKGIITDKLNNHNENKKKKKIEDNLYNEYRYTSYFKNSLNEINTSLDANSLKLSVNYINGIIYFNYNSDFVRSCNYSFSVSLETFKMLIEKEIIFDYLTSAAFTYMNDWLKKINEFLSNLNNIKNSTWEFSNIDKAYLIDIQLNYIHPLGYKKVKTQTIDLKDFSIYSIFDIKNRLAKTMDYMLSSTMDFCNTKYKNYRMIRITEDKNNA